MTCAMSDAIAAERPDFRRSFRLVDDVLSEFGEASLAERLYDAIPTDRPWEDVADLFGILVWSTSDNGSALTRVTDGWLKEGSDLRRCQIALHLDTYPFRERVEMEAVLRRVAERMPELAPKCDELIQSRRQLRE